MQIGFIMGRDLRANPDDDEAIDKRRRYQRRELGRNLKQRERDWRERELTGRDDVGQSSGAR